MRTKGSKNKSKFIAVKLSDINKIFKSESLINISTEYKFLFQESKEIFLDKEDNENEINIHNRIKFREINLE